MITACGPHTQSLVEKKAVLGEQELFKNAYALIAVSPFIPYLMYSTPYHHLMALSIYYYRVTRPCRTLYLPFLYSTLPKCFFLTPTVCVSWGMSVECCCSVLFSFSHSFFNTPILCVNNSALYYCLFLDMFYLHRDRVRVNCCLT